MKKFISIILIFVLALSFASCTKKQEKFSDSTFDYFDTVCSVIAYDDSEEAFNKKFKEFEKQLKHYNELFDIYNEYKGLNNLCTVNKLAPKQSVKVDKDIIELLNYGKDMYKTSGGKTNIALGSVLKIWHEKRDEGTSLPSEEELKKANEHTDINKLILDENNGTVKFEDSKMQLDVGAIAKGFAAKKLSDYVKNNLWQNALINLGGNVCAVGSKPDNQNWVVAIDNPDESKQTGYLCTVKVHNKCVITSADNQRYYTVNNKRYCHIIDPDTLMPAEYCHSVSVICNDSAYGDALSTALFNMPVEDGQALVKSLDNVEAVWVDMNYKNVYSEHFKDYMNEKK